MGGTVGGLFGGKTKAAPQVVQQTTPMVVDNSAQVQDEERRRKRKYGAASQFLSGASDISGVSTNKTTLGA